MSNFLVFFFSCVCRWLLVFSKYKQSGSQYDH